MDARRALRALARGGRSGAAEAGFLFRRGPLALRRGAEGAAREDRAGGAPYPFEGRRRLFRDAEPARPPGERAWPTAQSPAARAARLHTQGPETGEARGRYAAPQSKD